MLVINNATKQFIDTSELYKRQNTQLLAVYS